jgi:superfamily II DNA helicase RecQ
MAYAFFRVGVQGTDGGAEALNRFLAGGRIAAVTKEFVAAGDNSYWAFCVQTAEGLDAKVGGKLAGEKIDYREVLPEAEFAVFSKLRILRKELALKEAVPAYHIFSNEQLAQMVTGKVRSRTEMEKIEGIGSAKLDKYGAAFLAILAVAHAEPASTT